MLFSDLLQGCEGSFLERFQYSDRSETAKADGRSVLDSRVQFFVVGLKGTQKRQPRFCGASLKLGCFFGCVLKTRGVPERKTRTHPFRGAGPSHQAATRRATCAGKKKVERKSRGENLVEFSAHPFNMTSAMLPFPRFLVLMDRARTVLTFSCQRHVRHGQNTARTQWIQLEPRQAQALQELSSLRAQGLFPVSWMCMGAKCKFDILVEHAATEHNVYL